MATLRSWKEHTEQVFINWLIALLVYGVREKELYPLG